MNGSYHSAPQIDFESGVLSRFKNRFYVHVSFYIIINSFLKFNQNHIELQMSNNQVYIKLLLC